MERVKVGIVGCGGFSLYHLSNFAKVAEAQIVALTDPDSAHIDACVEAFPYVAGAKRYPHMDVMLGEGGLDGVLIGTPHAQHIGQIESAFGAGLHVIVDKPLCTTVSDCHAAIQARDKSGKVGLLSYQRHTSAEYRLIRDQIQSGRIGEVQYVSILLCQDWRPLTVGSWRQDPALSGGGMLLDSGSHMVDAILWCTGLIPETVSAFIEMRNSPVEINSAASIRFDNGALGTITVCGDAQGWHEDFTIWGTKGSIFYRGGKISVIDAQGSRLSVEEARGGSDPDRNFIMAILGKESVQSPFEAGLAVTQLTEAIYRSGAMNGAPVKVST